MNLGGGATHTLNELIATVEKHVGRKAVLNQMPDQKGDVPLTSADQVLWALRYIHSRQSTERLLVNRESKLSFFLGWYTICTRE